MKKPRPEHIFTRKWQFLHTEVLQNDQSWKCFPEFQFPHQIWKFYVLPMDFIYKREETMNGFIRIEDVHPLLPFFYNCPTDIFYVDHSIYEPDGFLNQCQQDIYRVEMIDEGNIYLYWEDVADLGELEECIRTKVKLFL